MKTHTLKLHEAPSSSAPSSLERPSALSPFPPKKQISNSIRKPHSAIFSSSPLSGFTTKPQSESQSISSSPSTTDSSKNAGTSISTSASTFETDEKDSTHPSRSQPLSQEDLSRPLSREQLAIAPSMTSIDGAASKDISFCEASHMNSNQATRPKARTGSQSPLKKRLRLEAAVEGDVVEQIPEERRSSPVAQDVMPSPSGTSVSPKSSQILQIFEKFPSPFSSAAAPTPAVAPVPPPAPAVAPLPAPNPILDPAPAPSQAPALVSSPAPAPVLSPLSTPAPAAPAPIPVPRPPTQTALTSPSKAREARESQIRSIMAAVRQENEARMIKKLPERILRESSSHQIDSQPHSNSKQLSQQDVSKPACLKDQKSVQSEVHQNAGCHTPTFVSGIDFLDQAPTLLSTPPFDCLSSSIDPNMNMGMDFGQHISPPISDLGPPARLSEARCRSGSGSGAVHASSSSSFKEGIEAALDLNDDEMDQTLSKLLDSSDFLALVSP